RFAPDGRRMAISPFNIVTVRDSNRLIFAIPIGAVQGPPLAQKERGTSSDLAYSRDGRLIATGVFDRVNLWDAETGRPVANWQCQSGHVNALSFGPGNVLVSAWDDGAVRFWVTPTDRAGPALKAHTGGAFSLALDATGTMLASLGWDGV